MVMIQLGSSARIVVHDQTVLRKMKLFVLCAAGMGIIMSYVCSAYAQSPGGNGPGFSFGLNLKSFGAYGDCRHDDTIAFQSAMGQIGGRTLYIPAGCYLITKPILVPFATGFRIVGEGQLGTKIQQQNDNTPILVFTQELTHSWELRDLEFAWSNPQPKQNANSVAILFSPVTTEKGGFFDFTISHVTFDNGFRGIYLAPAAQGTLPVWGFVIENVTANRQMSGSTINLAPSPSVGMPRCVLRNIYSMQASSEPQVRLNHCSSGTVDDIEDNDGLDTSLDLTSNDAMSVRAVHIEMHQMIHPDRPVIAVENSKIDIDGVSAYVWSEIPGRHYLVSNVAGGGSLSLKNVSLFGTAPEINRPGARNNANAHTFLMRLAGPVKLLNVEGVELNHADINPPDDVHTSEKVGALTRSPR
jgi:hypothetical protein